MRVSLVLLAALAGCAADPVVREVKVAVPVPCRVELPSAPAWATQALSADAGIWDQVKALLAERSQRIAYSDKLLAAAQACQ